MRNPCTNFREERNARSQTQKLRKDQLWKKTKVFVAILFAGESSFSFSYANVKKQGRIPGISSRVWVGIGSTAVGYG